MKKIIIKKLDLQFFMSVEQGKHLELIANNDDNEIKNIPYPLARIFADEETGEQFLEIYSDNNSIQIPVSDLKQALEIAESEIHSEKWFEENVYNNLNDE